MAAFFLLCVLRGSAGNCLSWLREAVFRKVAEIMESTDGVRRFRGLVATILGLFAGREVDAREVVGDGDLSRSEAVAL